MINPEFEELTKKRKAHVKSCQENHDGSYRVLADMYVDSSHSIYELIQNADDAKASKIQLLGLTQITKLNSA